MKWLGYTLTLLAGLIVGLIATAIFYQTGREGITLRDAVTIYDGSEPVAEIKRDAVLTRDKYTHAYQLVFYLDDLDPSSVQVHEPKETYYTNRLSRTAQKLMDLEGTWAAAWARGETVTLPESAGEGQRLAWPHDLPRDCMKEWAHNKGLLGLLREAIEDRVGPPVDVLENPSLNTELLLYDQFCIQLSQRRCIGWAPRAQGFERYYIQPDW